MHAPAGGEGRREPTVCPAVTRLRIRLSTNDLRQQPYLAFQSVAVRFAIRSSSSYRPEYPQYCFRDIRRRRVGGQESGRHSRCTCCFDHDMQPIFRSRTNLFISYRDSQQRSSRFSRARISAQYDDLDPDASEHQGLINADPTHLALNVDALPPKWYAPIILLISSLVPCLTRIPAGSTSQSRSKTFSQAQRPKVRPFLSALGPTTFSITARGQYLPSTNYTPNTFFRASRTGPLRSARLRPPPRTSPTYVASGCRSFLFLSADPPFHHLP